MKRILFSVFILVICALSIYAYSFPRWRTMPLHVYIPQNAGRYTILMNKAFDAWQTKTNNLVRFKYVSRQSEADIYVKFVDYVTNCNNESALGCCHANTRKGFFTQNYIEIGTKEPLRKSSGNGKIINSEADRSDNRLYGVMLHEIGHALGLAHSEDKNSIMYPMELNEFQYLTDTDLKLIRNKYN